MINIIKDLIAIFFLDQVLTAIGKWKKYVVFALLVLVFGIAHQVFVNNQPKTFFDTFSLDRAFTNPELKKSFRRVALQYHPDKFREGSADESKIVEEYSMQYELLGQEETRILYDKFGSNAVYNLRGEKHGDKKSESLELIFHRYRDRILKKDGIYYLIFAITFIAICSHQNLRLCRMICFLLIVVFYLLEVNFLWSSKFNPDIFDIIFPKMTIWQRVELLKGSIGLICVSIKALFSLKFTKKTDFTSAEKWKNIIGSISEDNADVLKQKLPEIENLTDKDALTCQENNIEKKKQVKANTKKRIKISMMIVMGIIYAYYFVL